MDATDCQPDFCLDLYEPSGHGRRRRRRYLAGNTNATEYTKFKENIEYTVTVPGEYDELKYAESDQCRHFVIISILLSVLLALSTILVSSSVPNAVFFFIYMTLYDFTDMRFGV